MHAPGELRAFQPSVYARGRTFGSGAVVTDQP